MLRIGFIGGGVHSRQNHLPSLAHYVSLSPEIIELAAFCDLDPEIAARITREYRFTHAYTDLSEMLETEVLEGCIAITPIPATAGVAKRIIEAGIPLLMEKPPGATPQEAREIAGMATRKNARVMVSMNRRFDPALRLAAEWRADRKLAYIKASMHRHNRSEHDFFTGTAIHALDALRSIAGDIGEYTVQAKRVGGAWWYTVQLEFESGASGMLEVMPTCGHLMESYELLGPGYRLIADIGDYGSGSVRAWENGEVVLQAETAQADPSWVKNGTHGETVEFISALLEGRTPHPTPSEVLQSVELCHQIQRRFQHQAAE